MAKGIVHTHKHHASLPAYSAEHSTRPFPACPSGFWNIPPQYTLPTPSSSRHACVEGVLYIDHHHPQYGNNIQHLLPDTRAEDRFLEGWVNLPEWIPLRCLPCFPVQRAHKDTGEVELKHEANTRSPGCLRGRQYMTPSPSECVTTSMINTRSMRGRRWEGVPTSRMSFRKEISTWGEYDTGRGMPIHTGGNASAAPWGAAPR